jgi:hypothetical protein
MAGAFVFSIDFESSEDNLELAANILFFGTGLKDRSFVKVTVLPADTVAQIKTKLVNAIIAEATAIGYSVPAGNIILPAFQRGA